MSSRRQSAATTPAPARRHQTPATTRSRNTPSTTTTARGAATTPAPARSVILPLPAYETPVAALTAAAQQSLSTLLTRSYPTTKIGDHLKRAAAALEESTSEINERLTEREEIVKRRRAKRARNNTADAELDDKENADLAELRERVEAMTGRLEGAMRKCVDGEAALGVLDTSVQEVVRSAGAAASAQRQHEQQKVQATQEEQQRREEEAAAAAANNEDNDEDPDATPNVTQPGSTIPSQLPPPPPPPSLTPAFTATLQARTDAYTALSQRTRYAQHPSYVSFKKLTWDAQHPGDEVPPMPHASTWFGNSGSGDATAGRGSPAPGVTGANPDRTTKREANIDEEEEGDSDDDIAVARVKISTRCPITMRPFVDPVSSTKCAHAFERAAVTAMLRGSGDARGTQCPVSGCDRFLTLKDLVTDKVLVRRIKRIQRAKEMGGADDGDDGEGETVDLEAGDGIEEGSGEEADEDDEEEVEDRRTAGQRRRQRRRVSDDIED